MSDRSRRLAGASGLLMAAILAACGGATAVSTPTPQPTPTPTPAGGEHRFSVGDPGVELVVTLPPGWRADASAASITASDGAELVISAWVPTAVYADPCSWKGAETAVGSAGDLVAALVVQPRRQARDARVQVGDVVAHLVFMSVPNGLDLATCDEGEFRSWIGSSPADARIQSGPGETDEVYVLDLAGQAVVLDASYFDATTDELAEIHKIIQSLEIRAEPTPTTAPS